MPRHQELEEENWKDEILRKTKDLFENFNIDVDQCLSNYLDQLEDMAENEDVDPDDSKINESLRDQLAAVKEINFTEAAAIISNSACIYSRKVDYFEKMLNQTLNVFRAEQSGKKIKNKDLDDGSKKSKNSDENGDNNENRRDDDDENVDDNDFYLAQPKIKILSEKYENYKSDIKLSVFQNLTNEQRSLQTANSSAAILARKPTALLGASNSDKGIELLQVSKGTVGAGKKGKNSSKQNSNGNNSIGYYKDFYTNRAVIDGKTGALILDHNTNKLLKKYLNDIELDPNSENLPINKYSEQDGEMKLSEIYKKQIIAKRSRSISQDQNIVRNVNDLEEGLGLGAEMENFNDPNLEPENFEPENTFENLNNENHDDYDPELAKFDEQQRVEEHDIVVLGWYE